MDRLLHSSQTHRVGNHYAENQVALEEGSIVEVIGVEQLEDYRLRLRFSDGFERLIDFGPFLRHSANPMVRDYLKPEKFANYRLEHGDLVWDDYGLCFSMADLYEGTV